VQKPNNLPVELAPKEQDLWEAKVRTETEERGNKQEGIQAVKWQEDLKTTHDQSQTVTAVQCLPHSIKNLL